MVIRPAETEGELRAWYKLYLDKLCGGTWYPRDPTASSRACWELLRPHGLMRLLLAEQHSAAHCTIVGGSIFLMSGQTVFSTPLTDGPGEGLCCTRMTQFCGKRSTMPVKAASGSSISAKSALTMKGWPLSSASGVQRQDRYVSLLLPRAAGGRIETHTSQFPGLLAVP